MKKIIALLLVLTLAVVAVGCTPQPTPQPLAPPTNQYENGYENEDEYGEYEYEYEHEDYYPGFGVEFEGEHYAEQEFYDDNVKITLFFDRPQFTHTDIVGMFATITNIGEEIVVFTKGSGSNRVPDAITVNLGELTALFRPDKMTMDLQTSNLEPGESVTFALPFAPYMHADTEAMFPPIIGFDRDIEFFQSDEWVRVQAGEIAGSISFSYVLRSADDFFIIVDGDEIFELKGSFTVNLTENGGGGAAQPPQSIDEELGSGSNGETDEEEQE